jgi:hypothetical protein
MINLFRLVHTRLIFLSALDFVVYDMTRHTTTLLTKIENDM